MVARESTIYEDFTPQASGRWKEYVVGDATLEATGRTLLFINNRTSSTQYADAQIDDYQGLPRSSFRWRPPVKMTVRARFSDEAGALVGTAGFGFWNDPFFMTGRRMPAMPRAVWFFYASPPSNMKLDLSVPGRGWKAATIDAGRISLLLLAPAVPVAVPLMNVGPLYRGLWPVAQRAMGVSEATVQASMTEWHTYVVEWATRQVRFSVDGDLTLESESSPGGPLGFVMWLDNQYAVVTPWGRLGYGLLESPARQFMEVDTLAIEPG